MSGRILLGALLLSLTTAPLAAGEKPERHVITPSGGWQVDFDANRCRAGRLFGTGEDRTLLMFEQMGPKSSLPWTIAGAAVATNRSDRTKIRLQFGPGFPAKTELEQVKLTHGDFGTALRGEFAEASSPESEKSLKRSTWGSLIPEEGDKIEWIEVARPGRIPQRLATGKLGDVFKVMNACIDDLVQSWGMAAGSAARMAKAPSWLNRDSVARRISSYYPRQPEEEGRSADLFLRVMIDEQGGVSDCTLVAMTSADQFDDKPCESVRTYARFAPALDHEGRPMKSFYTTTIAYRAS